MPPLWKSLAHRALKRSNTVCGIFRAEGLEEGKCFWHDMVAVNKTWLIPNSKHLRGSRLFFWPRAYSKLWSLWAFTGSSLLIDILVPSCTYGRTSVAWTLMACLTRLVWTCSWVPRKKSLSCRHYYPLAQQKLWRGYRACPVCMYVSTYVRSFVRMFTRSSDLIYYPISI